MSSQFSGTTIQDRIDVNYTTGLGDFTILAFAKDDKGAAAQYSRIADKSWPDGFWMGHDGAVTTAQYGGGVVQPSTVGDYLTGTTFGTWQFHGIRRSGTTKTVFLNANQSDFTVPSTTLVTENLRIGNSDVYTFPANTDYWVGNIIRVALWDVAITDSEAKAFRLGFPPRQIRPQSLKVYYPLLRDTNQIWQEVTTGTVLNVTFSDAMPSVMGYI